MKISALKLVTLPVLAGALAMTGHGQVGPRAVEGAGCVWEGEETGCLMVTDKETDVLYNLLITSGERPAIGTGVFFMGNLHQGQTACMQGRPVDVKSWVKRKMPCSEPEKKKNKPSPY
ncbi:MAG TPA: hypothetical protein VIB39_13985 [Candidatus Angelobacter sp.]|jgi:hypothetical protein